MRKGSGGKAQLVLLDHGLYEVLSDDIRHSLCNFWESIVLRRYEEMKKYAKELNVNGEGKIEERRLRRSNDRYLPQIIFCWRR